MKKKKKKHHTQLQLSKSCIKNRDNVFLPSNTTSYVKINTISRFKIRETQNRSELTVTNNDVEEVRFCRRFDFTPTEKQIKLLPIIFKRSIHIYNVALKYMKNIRNKKISFFDLRKAIDEDIKKSKLNKHFADEQVHRAHAMYKSAMTNFTRGNINSFRIRYRKYHKYINSSIYIPNDCIGKDGDISHIGNLDLLLTNNNDVLDENIDVDKYSKYTIDKKIVRSIEIIHNNRENKYEVLLSFKRNEIEYNNKKREEFISLDPGLYPFLAGITPNNSCFIGTNCKSYIENKLNNIDNCMNSNKSNYKKRRHSKKVYRMIKDKVTDFHWKSIKYLTSNYNKILIGDLSIKGICSNEKDEELKKMNKRIFYGLNLYKFKERLQFKCKERGVEYEEVNERYTSKTCSVCGFYKADLNSKTYECNKCNIKLHRDFNGARCIYYSHMLPR